LFGRTAVVIWIVAITAVVLSQALALVGISAVFLLPIGGVGQILGSLFTSIAVWRIRRLDRMASVGTRHLDGNILRHDRRSDRGHSHSFDPRCLSQSHGTQPRSRGVWQVAWFLLGLALFIEAGKATRTYVPAE
jgi:hypothetical protein